MTDVFATNENIFHTSRPPSALLHISRHRAFVFQIASLCLTVCSWEKGAAEKNFTRAEQLRHHYQHQLGRRETEITIAEVRREIFCVRIPSPSSSQSNKFKTRMYNSSWAHDFATAKLAVQTSPCSCEKSTSSKTRSSRYKGSGSRFPAIISETQNKTVELAKSSKTSHRVNAPLAFSCNREQSAQCHDKHRCADVGGRVLEVSTHGKKNKLTQSKAFLKGKHEMKHLCSRANMPTWKDPVSISTLHSHLLLQPLISSPQHSHTHWPNLSPLHCQSPSPDEELSQQLTPYLSEVFSTDSSVTDELEGISSEDIYGENLSTDLDDFPMSSDLESIGSESPYSADALGNTLSDSLVVPLSGRLPKFDVLSIESQREGEDDDLSASWQERDRGSYYIPVQRIGSLSSIATTSHSHSAHSSYSPQSLSSRLSTLGIPSRAFVHSDGYGIMPALVQTGSAHVAPLPPIAKRDNRSFVASVEQTAHHLPELVRGPGVSLQRTQTLSEMAPPRTGFFRRQEEADDIHGINVTSITNDTSTSPISISSGEAEGPSLSGHMNNFISALMTLHNIHENLELMEHQAERGATVVQEAQTAPASNQETVLYRMKQRLLEESSDEEEAELCRICQSGASSSTNPLLTPCQCCGSLRFVHHDCLKRWIQAKIHSGSELSAVRTCELCKGYLALDLDNFDLEDYYQSYSQQQQAHHTDVDLSTLLLLQQTLTESLQVTAFPR